MLKSITKSAELEQVALVANNGKVSSLFALSLAILDITDSVLS